jgi:hypothetical protein
VSLQAALDVKLSSSAMSAAFTSNDVLVVAAAATKLQFDSY